MTLILTEYFLFFTFVLLSFYLLPQQHQWKLLLIASIFFYMANIPGYIAVPALIIFISYSAGILIEKANRPAARKAILVISLLANIGILVFFKYINFITESLFGMMNLISRGTFQPETAVRNPWVVSMLIPLGISYITFQAIGYTIEIYRAHHSAEKNLGVFSAYLMFFPKILSGPIERAHNFIPQLYVKKCFDYRQVTDGLKLIAWGLFKKLVIAARLADMTNVVFSKPEMYAGAPLIAASLLFTIQLYADFSGYTDIAIGSANALGFQLMRNFDSPFIAKSTTELWRRWHISLSTWFGEYVYNPIAIATRNWDRWAVVYASLVTFLILGLWHGPTWNFAMFGLLQGIVLSVEFLTRKTRKKIASRLPEAFNSCFGVCFTFAFFSFALIFFKAGTFADAVYIITHLFSFSGDVFKAHSLLAVYVKSQILIAAALICFMLVVEYLGRNYDVKGIIASRPAIQRWARYYAVMFSRVIVGGCTASHVR